MALIKKQTGYRGGLGTAHKRYKPREGPPITTDIRAQFQQKGQMADAPRAAAQEEGQVSLAQIYSAILEMRNSQQEFQSEVNNRLNALTESVSALEEAINTPARLGRRLPRTPLRDPVAASTSQAPPTPQDQAPVIFQAPPQDPAE